MPNVDKGSILASQAVILTLRNVLALDDAREVARLLVVCGHEDVGRIPNMDE